MIDNITFNLTFKQHQATLRLPPYSAPALLLSKTKTAFYNLPKLFDLVDKGKVVTPSAPSLALLFQNRKFVNLKVQSRSKPVDLPRKEALPAQESLSDHGTCECPHDNYSYFCRKCKLFLCSSCRAKYVMSNHTYTSASKHSLNTDFRTYCRTLQAEAALAVRAASNQAKQAKASPLVDYDSRKEMLKRKLDALYKLHETALAKVPVTPESLDSLQEEGKGLSAEVEESLKEMAEETEDDAVMKNELKFDNVAGLEGKLEQLNRGVAQFKAHFELSKKIEEVCVEVEKVLEEASKADLGYSEELNLSEVTKKLVNEEK